MQAYTHKFTTNRSTQIYERYDTSNLLIYYVPLEQLNSKFFLWTHFFHICFGSSDPRPVNVALLIYTVVQLSLNPRQAALHPAISNE